MEFDVNALISKIWAIYVKLLEKYVPADIFEIISVAFPAEEEEEA